MNDRLLYKPEAAADALSLSRGKVFQLLASGELKSISIGRSRRIPAEALREFIERRGGGAA